MATFFKADDGLKYYFSTDAWIKSYTQAKETMDCAMDCAIDCASKLLQSHERVTKQEGH